MAGESIPKLAAGDPAPDFELEGTDGRTYSLADFADQQAVLLVFTCNHCPYAKAKIDTLNALSAAYDDVAVVGVNPNDPEAYADDSFERMQELVREGRIEYDAYLFDESQTVAAAYGAVCTPDPFLLANGDEGFRLAYHGRLDDATNPDDEPSGDPGFEMRAAIESVRRGESIDRDFEPARGCTIKWRPGKEPAYWSEV